METNLAGPKRLVVGWEDSSPGKMRDGGSPTVHRLLGASPDSDLAAEASHMQSCLSGLILQSHAL